MNLCVSVCVWGGGWGHNSAQSNVYVPKPEKRTDLGEIRAPWGSPRGRAALFRVYSRPDVECLGMGRVRR